MDLKEFVVGAVSEISEAVVEADEKIKELGGMVNPGTHTSSSAGGRLDRDPKSPNFVAPRTKLDFDIAVSAESEKSGEVGAKAKIWVVEASLGGEALTKNESVSRLTFSIEVVLPHDKDQFTRIGMVKGK